MKCSFDKDDIIAMMDSVMSEEKKAKINRHMEGCRECRCYYEGLQLAQKLAESEPEIDGDFYRKVMAKVDPERYRRSGVGFALKGILHRISPPIKIAIAPVLVSVCALLVYFNSSQFAGFFDKYNGNLSEATPWIEQTAEATQNEPEQILAKMRPAVKEDTIEIEGMKEEKNFYLITSDALGLSTYIPEDMIGEEKRSNGISELIPERIVVYANYNGVLNEEVSILLTAQIEKEKILESELIQSAIDAYKAQNYTVTLPETPKGSLFEIYNGFIVSGTDGNGKAVSKEVFIFTHAGRVYHFTLSCPTEYSEGFYPRATKVLQEIRWYDEDNNLNDASMQNNEINNDQFDELKAISSVIKDHPDFPSNPVETITKIIPIGGKQGNVANVKYNTEIESEGEAAYKVTLKKDWGISVNGKYVKSYWMYKVSPTGVTLLESVDNDGLINIIK